VARIRTIKPEFWSDDTITECSLSARLLFIGIWNFADDAGNLDRSHKQIKTRVFPLDNINCEPLIIELLAHGLLIEYSVSDKKYLHIPGFTTHQLINRPSKPVVPGYEASLKTHGALTEPSVTTHSVREGKGREETGSADAPVTRKSSGGRAEPLPDNFALTDAMRSQALANFPDCDPDAMFTAFRAHHESKGSVMKKWPAAWTTWLGNAVKFGYPKKSTGGSSRGLPRLNVG
jgi:hypothetical protein